MRELYATELQARTAPNEIAHELVDQWLTRHLENDDTATGTQDTVSDGSVICLLEQTNTDTGMLWRSEIALGPPSEPARVTVRIRIRAAGTGTVAPVEYQFRTPAIVRTLMRELDVFDGDTPCTPDLGPEVGPSDVSKLLALLTTPDRRLPVIVVSRRSHSGDVLIDTSELSRELAGVAHVRVLSSAHTSRVLTDLLGQPLSVFDGALRVYFPGFNSDDDPYRHRLTFPDRMNEHTVGHLRSWMGTLSAAAIVEHPAYAVRRADQRDRIKSAVEHQDVTGLREWIELLEEDNGELSKNVEEEKKRSAALELDLSHARAEAEQLKYQFSQMERARSTRPAATSEDSAPQTVAEAVDLLEELAATSWYATRVELSSTAVAAARAFANYNHPAELLRAGQAVLEVGAAYHDNTLGEPPKDFFNRRGFGYGAQPSPHLKVDESTSPDQCLRIYWTEDPRSRKWTITDMGFHK